MKIFINGENGFEKSVFLIEYIRDIHPELIRDVILVDLKAEERAIEWASGQEDFTYVYFEEEITPGAAYNRIIRELNIEDDVLITDNCHLPLVGSLERIASGLRDNSDAFAVGPVSNSFEWDQSVNWSDAEDAIAWSEREENKYEEVLFLLDEVILFSGTVIKQEKPFHEGARNVKDMIMEKCIREFLEHKKMYVCKNAGFWDVRDNDHKDAFLVSTEFMEKEFDMHYLNVRGNDYIIDCIKECITNRDEEMNVLEIGCDCGGTLFALKKIFGNIRLFGTDINEGALKFASEFAEVKVNDIEKQNLDFEGVKFDVIIFADVLEHLRDPLAAVRYCKTLLNPGGRVVTSIPNLMNIEVMKLLLDGFFPYSEVGLLDKTHIHMFTYNEIIRMFVNDAGYNIEKISMNGELSKENEHLADKLLELGKAEKFMYQAFQYQVVARID